ncbi:three prime repair exonuclease 2-like [Culex quinquefasciatus]|uniref:three prime repair exonuclease 2-like n=1 Tax=Culex quinquefasciatus TaxID=7176 RepID=UPI0018E39A24|nr:three prime repair exonuclease 2-like [Culex quinquefasciatus]
MADIGSFVFLHQETTGLSGDFGTINVTELSLIACSKLHFLNTTDGNIPRVLHKLTFCFNPQGSISTIASQISGGLYNNLLERESKFDYETAQSILLFLKRLQPPLCLVAHNGIRFDFGLLKNKLKVLEIMLPVETYCIDTLTFFRNVENIPNPSLGYFRLVSIYERYFHVPLEINAEEKAKALLKCVIRYGPMFVQHAEMKCVEFNEI